MGLILIIGSLVAFVILLVPATEWLLGGDPAVESDMIVVLAGGSRERATTAIDLYRNGMGRVVMLTDPSGFPDKMIEHLESEGVPSRAIVPPLQPSHLTLEDARAIRQVVRRQEAGSILVVTSPHHCRRVRLILSRVLADLSVRVTVTASDSLYMNPERWWETRQGWITVPQEFPKLVWAWVTTPTEMSL